MATFNEHEQDYYAAFALLQKTHTGQELLAGIEA